MNKPKLTNKQKLFVKYYLVDFNATQAAIKAGYSKKTAREIGPENLKKPVIQAYIDKMTAKRAEKIDVSAEWVLRRLVEVTERSMTNVPVKNEEGKHVGEYRFNSSGANRALELIGKHCGMWAEKTNNSEVNHEFLLAVSTLIKAGATKTEAIKKIKGD